MDQKLYRIPQLEWDGPKDVRGPAHVWTSDGEFHCYRIWNWVDTAAYMIDDGDSGERVGTFDSLDEAKAAAQSHFEARMASGLVEVTEPLPSALDHYEDCKARVEELEAGRVADSASILEYSERLRRLMDAEKRAETAEAADAEIARLKCSICGGTGEITFEDTFTDWEVGTDGEPCQVQVIKLRNATCPQYDWKQRAEAAEAALADANTRLGLLRDGKVRPLASNDFRRPVVYFRPIDLANGTWPTLYDTLDAALDAEIAKKGTDQ